MKRELEDIFREGLGNRSSKPSPQTWSRINNRLWWKGIVSTLTNSPVKPSSSVWTSIALSLWFKNFVRFSPGSFNIHYLGLALTFVFGTYSLTTNDQYQPAQIAQTVISSDILSGIPAQTNPVQNNAITVITPVINKTSPVNSGSSFSKPADNIIQNTEVLSQVPEVKSNRPFEDRITDQEELNLLPVLGFNLNSEKPSFNISSTDSIVDWLGKPVTIERFRFSADLFFSYANATTFNRTMDLTDDFSLDPEIKAGPVISGGFGMNYQWKNLCFQGGLAYSGMNQSSSYNTLHYKTDTVLINWILDGGRYVYDTLWVLNLDSFINGNEVYFAVIDSQYVHTPDTISVSKPVTTKEIQKNTANAKLSYFEIPLSAGYTVSSGRFDYRLKVSFIPGLLTYTYGNMVNPFAEFGDIPVQRETYSRWLFSGGASLEIHYKPFSRMGISLEPFYRRNLNTLFVYDFPFNVKTSSWGCKLSLRYYLR